jgi:hypothetical protein
MLKGPKHDHLAFKSHNNSDFDSQLRINTIKNRSRQCSSFPTLNIVQQYPPADRKLVNIDTTTTFIHINNHPEVENLVAAELTTGPPTGQVLDTSQRSSFSSASSGQTATDDENAKLVAEVHM